MIAARAIQLAIDGGDKVSIIWQVPPQPAASDYDLLTCWLDRSARFSRLPLLTSYVDISVHRQLDWTNKLAPLEDKWQSS